MTSTNASLFRVDKFIVPAAARDTFLDGVRGVHQLIGAQPGCVQSHVLEQVGGPGEFNFVTIVEWADAQHMDAARRVITAHHAQAGIDVDAFRTQHGIRADVAAYHKAPLPSA